jgi:hypothetical protein
MDARFQAQMGDQITLHEIEVVGHQSYLP